jgi:hypothetical protein
MNTAKLALAVMLTVGFLSSIAPLVPVSAGSMCRLDCCAGRAPHAAGSCMNGTCEASLRTHQGAAKSDHASLAHGDQLCGLNRRVVMKSLSRMRTHQPPSQAKPAQTMTSAAAFVKPCQPDCGAGACGFTNPKRPKNSAVMADAVRPRGPTAIHLSNPGSDRIRILDALCRQCAPRGPPVSFS